MARPTKEKAPKLLKVVRERVYGVEKEGVYERRFYRPDYPYWVLLRWRPSVSGEWGDWHRVHGNQRKQVAGFQLVRDQLPSYAEEVSP
jgi:hypothetical protein